MGRTKRAHSTRAFGQSLYFIAGLFDILTIWLDDLTL